VDDSKPSGRYYEPEREQIRPAMPVMQRQRFV
jgi:hypothetical protein